MKGERNEICIIRAFQHRNFYRSSPFNERGTGETEILFTVVNRALKNEQCEYEFCKKKKRRKKKPTRKYDLGTFWQSCEPIVHKM